MVTGGWAESLHGAGVLCHSCGRPDPIDPTAVTQSLLAAFSLELPSLCFMNLGKKINHKIFF